MVKRTVDSDFRPKVEYSIAHSDSNLSNLISGLVHPDPKQRLSAEAALKHLFFSKSLTFAIQSTSDTSS